MLNKIIYFIGMYQLPSAEDWFILNEGNIKIIKMCYVHIPHDECNQYICKHVLKKRKP